VHGQDARLGGGTQPAYDLIRQHVPFLEADAIMYPYMNRVIDLVASGQIVDAVNRRIGVSWRTAP
jgi:histidine ammonia-lyase